MGDNKLFCDTCSSECRDNYMTVPVTINWSDVEKMTVTKVYICEECSDRIDKKHGITEMIESEQFEPDLGMLLAIADTYMERQKESLDKEQFDEWVRKATEIWEQEEREYEQNLDED
ncbi:hypothetical protein 010DV004_246 [Bacillus phage 010DV004]|nr:hypothetical protein 010DV004_246 [Bacillus phage 010DV004]QZA69458.1 hypothetical protein 010DV005_246 [Bacillus phage 010DV005]QZA70029.1 hypothetical protein 043JT007_248 [Bacillus phage 043JT007]